MLIRDEIIRFIETNRISSTQIADCLGKNGASAKDIADPAVFSI